MAPLMLPVVSTSQATSSLGGYATSTVACTAADSPGCNVAVIVPRATPAATELAPAMSNAATPTAAPKRPMRRVPDPDPRCRAPRFKVTLVANAFNAEGPPERAFARHAMRALLDRQLEMVVVGRLVHHRDPVHAFGAERQL